MSEKKAKEQRKDQKKTLYLMTIEVVDFGNGDGKVEVKGIPNDFNHAIGMITDATKAITRKFVKAAQEGNVEMAEHSRIVPAYALPKGGFGSA